MTVNSTQNIIRLRTLAAILSSILSLFFLFFFSSRRRHTRLQGDWSSDVCSSDLPVPGHPAPRGRPRGPPGRSHSLRARPRPPCPVRAPAGRQSPHRRPTACGRDRKSTRLNSSHLVISYAVFCLKKKKKSK